MSNKTHFLDAIDTEAEYLVRREAESWFVWPEPSAMPT